MAELTLGGGPSDVLVEVLSGAVRARGPAVCTVWSAPTGGTRYDVVVDEQSVPSFRIGSTGRVPVFTVTTAGDAVVEVWLQVADAAERYRLSVTPGPAGQPGAPGAPGGSDAETAQRIESGPLTQAALSATMEPVIEEAVPPLALGVVRAERTKPIVLGFDGDSQTTSGHQQWGMSMQNQVLRGLGSQVTTFNAAVGGQDLNNMIGRGAAYVDVHYDADAADNILVAWAGTNQMGSTLEVVQSLYQQYVAARRAAGWKVVVGTMLPRSNAGTPADYETKRQAFNTWLRSNWMTFADALADLAADSRIGDAGDETNLTYYRPDLVHINNTGAMVVAQYVRGALATLGLGSVTRPPESVFVPATNQMIAAGTPADVLRGSAAWCAFDGDVIETVAVTQKFPTGLGLMYVDFIWHAPTASGGNVVWTLSLHEIDAATGSYNPAPSFSANATGAASATANNIVRTRWASNFAVDTSRFQHLRIGRNATHAADTLAGDAYLLGVIFVPINPLTGGTA
ncbi:hypothetical protein INN71_02800 [Nocardioides sp. ChNu-153]|uniref:hypothetical protein n=1 Tax=Nocardioides sp. ChNu-153 TaxID=2779364 RepID=UPI0026570326|nr:hypothetical protein [Nocardioides sp. ChNu-153]MDN7120315.1 hypothetical protein [Nocardioides sp. ChNu-153]